MPPHINHVERRASRRAARQYVSETHDHKPTRPEPYNSKDMAAICGVTLDCFYKRRRIYQVREGMPAPYKPGCWDRASVDAWRTKNHPARPQAKPANDVETPLMPRNDAEWADYLHRHYAKEGV